MVQTAVSWYNEQLNMYGDKAFNKEITLGEYHIKKQELLEQSKEMEKQQIITAMIYEFNQQNTLPYGMEYLLKREGMLEDCENYYNETYNK